MSLNLASRTALVTGGSRGIGAAIVRALSGAGARVAFSFLDAKDAADALARETGAVALRADLSAPEAAPALVRDAHARLGALDVLVNNAGVNAPKPFLDQTMEDVEAALRVNYSQAFLATQEFARLCRKPGARVVNVGSIAGVLARPGSAAYGAAKAAMHSLTRSAAEALAPGVSVNAVAPGMVDTGTHPEMMTPEFVRRIEAQVPMRRFATSDEIAQCVLFFAAGPAYVTGQVLVVDGGIGNVYFR
jgi:NAD(P)-dependent dehydrogenase (short-subunit alcohol dehydrogenase family)